MKDVVEELIQKGVATKNEDGSVGVVFPKETKLPSNMLQKRDGTHGYFASDLTTIKYRMTNGVQGLSPQMMMSRVKLCIRLTRG